MIGLARIKNRYNAAYAAEEIKFDMESKILSVLDANGGTADWESIASVLDARELRQLHAVLRDLKKRGIAERYLQSLPDSPRRKLVVRRMGNAPMPTVGSS